MPLPTCSLTPQNPSPTHQPLLLPQAPFLIFLLLFLPPVLGGQERADKLTESLARQKSRDPFLSRSPSQFSLGAMARCARCCIHSSMRAMNVIVNLCGVAMIIYSLWLEKMWEEGVALLPTIVNLPLPWFIYTCLGVGIAVCLSTIFGHAVANCIGNSSLCIYIITLLSLLFLEATVLVLIFFKMNWEKLISEYIDEHHEKFKTFVVFHLKMCRLIVILILMLQIIVIVFAVILWAIGTGPRTDHTPDVRSLRQSFLVWPSSPMPVENLENCRRCGELNNRNPLQGLVSYLKGVIMTRFHRTPMNDD